MLGQIGYDYDGRRFNFGARTRYTSSAFRQAGSDEEAARVDQVSLGLDFGERGRLVLLFLHRADREEEDATSLAATNSLSLGPGAPGRRKRIVRPSLTSGPLAYWRTLKARFRWPPKICRHSPETSIWGGTSWKACSSEPCESTS